MKAAMYARYSTDGQSEASIEDQHRVCERLAERHGFDVIARFFDRAISGGTSQRPGYQDMLGAARRHEFDVIIAEDTSRLWRNLAEQSPRLAELSDLGIHVVTHDLDTRHESAEIMGAVGGAMASAYRKEIGRRTRRGLEGRARAGKPTGRAVYGYVPASQSPTKEMEIDPAEAEVILRAFQMYADGRSPRAIANIFNSEGIPSPRAGSCTSTYRALGWRGSAIRGDRARKLGLLNNDMYRGLIIWGRTKWTRSAADSSMRTVFNVPEDQWIQCTDERLRIVPQELWDAAQNRQKKVRELIGDRVSKGMLASQANRTGAGPKYLFSGLLECSVCGARYVICGRDVYGCSGNVNGGSTMCANDAKVRRQPMEEELLRGLKAELLSPAPLEEIEARVRELLAKPKVPSVNSQAQIKELKGQIDNMTDAIASGALRASPALGARLAAAETELERLEQAQRDLEAITKAPERMLEDLSNRVAKAVGSLQLTLASGDIVKSRQEIKDHIGRIEVEADEQEIRFYSNKMHAVSKILRRFATQAILFGSGGRI